MAITISGNGITTNEILDGTITTDDISASDVTSLKSGRKNLIINGGFDVWQRGTSFSGLSTYSYFADRWQCAISTTCSRSTDTPTDEGFNYSAKLEAGSGGNILRMMLEDSYRLLGSNSFTFSFWIKGSVASTGGMDVGDQQSKTFSISTSWTKITQSFTAINTSAHGGTANDYFDITSSVAGDFYITGVQLEVGDTATDFEHRSYGEELALCQRYFYSTMYLRSANSLTAPTNNAHQIQGTRHKFADITGYRSQDVMHPVRMRTPPSIVFYNHNNSGVSGQWQLYSETGASQNFAGFTTDARETSFIFAGYTGVSVGTSGNSCVSFVHWTADAEL